MSEVSAPWLHATLADAAESLAAALEKLEAHTDEETASCAATSSRCMPNSTTR